MPGSFSLVNGIYQSLHKSTNQSRTHQTTAHLSALAGEKDLAELSKQQPYVCPHHTHLSGLLHYCLVL